MKLGKRPLQKPRKIWNIDNMANQAGSITHYVDLNVQTNGFKRTIRLLITNIGSEDIVLGYPWMAAFKPQFTWRNGIISKKALPVIIQSVNPLIPGKEPIIARLQGETKGGRLKATTSTKLAIKVQQYTKKVEVPQEY